MMGVGVMLGTILKSSAQDLHPTLHSVVTPGGLWGPVYEVLWIKHW